jgi:hypothetical protein
MSPTPFESADYPNRPGDRRMVGQNVQSAAADKRAEATFHDPSATLHEVAHVQGHLAA